jgi:glycosyltransferase involved in cell wall biosynthesis
MNRVLDFFPDWRRSNPFQGMLFSGLDRVGATPEPVVDLVGHLAADAPPGRVLNVHWTTPVVGSAATDADAEATVSELATALPAFRAGGGRLVWTVHNVLPHEARHVESEIAVARLLADHADVVHVLSAATLEATQPWYRLDPGRVVCIPHSSYVGVYPDRVTRAGARRRLGLRPDDTVLVTLGQIRPYKGLDRLLDLVEEASAANPRLRLLVAGSMARHPDGPAFAERLAAMPCVVAHTSRVRDRQVQVWMRAADLAVLPYLKVLNSGSFFLAESFGLPVVAPRVGALAAYDGAGHTRLFDDDAGLAAVLSGAIRDLVEDPAGAARARASAEQAARGRPVEAMAAAFADAVAPLWEFTET